MFLGQPTSLMTGMLTRARHLLGKGFRVAAVTGAVVSPDGDAGGQYDAITGMYVGPEFSSNKIHAMAMYASTEAKLRAAFLKFVVSVGVVLVVAFILQAKSSINFFAVLFDVISVGVAGASTPRLWMPKEGLIEAET